MSKKKEDPWISVVGECLSESYGFEKVRRINGTGIPKWEVRVADHTVTFTLSAKPSPAKPIPRDITVPPCLKVREGSSLCRANFLCVPERLLPDVFMVFSPPQRRLKDQTIWLYIDSTRPDFHSFRSRIASRLASIGGPERALTAVYAGEMKLSNF